MIRVTYIISDINKASAFEWISYKIDKEKFLLSFILLNPGSSVLERYLLEHGFETYQVTCRGKKDWPLAIFKTYKILKRNKPKVVHCHLIQANTVGLIAAKIAGINTRIYTRHHSSLHHKYFPKGVWWDRLANYLSTHIIAISALVQTILVDWEKVQNKKVSLIPHGIELQVFSDVDLERITNFKSRYLLLGKGPVIGVISRFTEWKGVQYIIPAFGRLLKDFPNALLLLLNANGDYENQIKELLKQIPENSYRVVKFENDIAAAYRSMDVFVHVPIDEHSEAFGQIYVEALAARVPSVFTLSGIAADFVKNEENAYVIPFKNSEAIFKSIQSILYDPTKANAIADQGYRDVQKLFSIEKMINSLEELYEYY